MIGLSAFSPPLDTDHSGAFGDQDHSERLEEPKTRVRLILEIPTLCAGNKIARLSRGEVAWMGSISEICEVKTRRGRSDRAQETSGESPMKWAVLGEA
jgi:hypothetical protein